MIKLFFIFLLLPANLMARNKNIQEKILDSLWKTVSDSPPPQKPVYVTSRVHINHINSIDESAGVMELVLKYTLMWKDERLSWNSTDFDGPEQIYISDNFFVRKMWWPDFEIRTLTYNFDFKLLHYHSGWNIMILKSGIVVIEPVVRIKTTCTFSFGDFPNDYQNCTIFLNTGSKADRIIFTMTSSLLFSMFPETPQKSIKVQDFQLLGIENDVVLTTGDYVIEEGFKVPLQYLNSKCRYIFMFKRVNKIIFSRISIPMIVVCTLIALSGFLDSTYSLSFLIMILTFQIFFGLSLAKILPTDIGEVPAIGSLSLFMQIECFLLIIWNYFSNRVRFHRQFLSLHPKIEKFVEKTDYWLPIGLVIQYFGNMYTIWNN